ncbi:ras-related GTP-binding protein A-like [Penaeus indicus]|uniref:ras-related GTP-binding protein A-like n=1 Tax=Penaeus indicus TaxID=29960 RepID=UPI00300D38D6
MKKKVLLMGKSGSGKTSMRSIIFANYIARDTSRLGATIDVEHSHVRFLGNLVLNLWDCGGQEAFMENYFASQRDNIFRNVEVLIYVFDVESRELGKLLNETLYTLMEYMDMNRFLCIEMAWSNIVYELIPNVKELEQNLKEFTNIIDADEVLLFERATFLVISHYRMRPHRDANRFEKVSNIIKQFKLSCSKLAAHFQSMEVRNSNFAAFIDIFTSNTYCMVIMSDASIPSAATLINIRNARKHFEKLERMSQGHLPLSR